MAGQTDATLLGAHESFDFGRVRRMAGGALTGRHRRMKTLLFERLRHLWVAGQTEIFSGKVGFLWIGARYLMATAAAALSEGLVRNGLDQSFVIGAVRVMAFLTSDLLHRKRRVGSFDLGRTQIVAGYTKLSRRRFQQRALSRGVRAVAKQTVARLKRRMGKFLGLVLERAVAGET